MSVTDKISDPQAAVALATITVFHARVPLKKSVKHASHTRQQSDNVVVECVLSDGTVGYGESAPRDYVTGETIETSIGLLKSADWSQIRPAKSFAEAVGIVRDFELPQVAGDDRQCVGNAARCAAELALLDAYGRRFGVSLVRLLEYLPDLAEIHEFRPRCRYSGVITSKKSLRERFSAGKQRVFGFKHCKIKVGTEGQDDVARMRVFRRILGRKMDLRIDANEAWSSGLAAEKIRELEPFRISSVEQPVAHEDADWLAEIRGKVSTPIMLDESFCSRVDLLRAAERKICDLVNIRLSKCGGLLRSMELAALAAANGLGYQLGCQVGETGILSAAGRHFACSVRGIRYLEGSYDSHLVRERLTRENLTFEWGGVAPALTNPGLGVCVDAQSLDRISVAKDRIHG